MKTPNKAPMIVPEHSEVYQEARDRYDRTPVNYAGKYVVIGVVSGAGWEGDSAVNAQTGKMVDLPDVYCDLEESCKKYHRVDFRQNSNLIILTGVLNVDKENASKDICRYYYYIKDDKMVLVDVEYLEARK